MRIIGCDLHAAQQTIAMLDRETGEVVERTLPHEGTTVRDFYASLPPPIVVGIEATGSMGWFLRLMEELGVTCHVGDAAKIRKVETRRQKHDRRDAALILELLSENRFPSIWMTGALLDHLKAQPSATIVNVSSVLGFIPLAWSAVYSFTKAAVHSYSLSLRYALRGTSVRVLELIPPWVQTDLLGKANSKDPRAMPLDEFMAETMRLLATDVEEIVVEQARPLRDHLGPDEAKLVTELNDLVAPVQWG